jgi:hypothetical protein
MLKYIEKCTGANHDGPAWIARVRLSKTGRTVYFNGRALKRARGGIGAGNHWDLETGDAYWISGVKRAGTNRHWAGTGSIAIEAAAVDEYLAITGQKALDLNRFVIVHDLDPPDPKKFIHIENDADAYDDFRFPDLDTGN